MTWELRYLSECGRSGGNDLRAGRIRAVVSLKISVMAPRLKLELELEISTSLLSGGGYFVKYKRF